MQVEALLTPIPSKEFHQAETDPTYGRVQVFDAPALARLGCASGWQGCVSVADGAWLVLDRPVD